MGTETITLHVRGSGGARFDVDVPAEGTHRRERLLEQLASGDLTALDDDGDTIDRVALVEELSPKPVVVEDVEVDGLDALGAMTTVQLRQFAEDHAIELGGARKKAELLEVIREATADHDTDDD